MKFPILRHSPSCLRRIRLAAEPGMVFIPAGDYPAGARTTCPYANLIWYPTRSRTTPRRRITSMPSISTKTRSPTRYAAFVKGTHRANRITGLAARSRRADALPVVDVSWEDGAAFASGRATAPDRGRMGAILPRDGRRPQISVGRANPNPKLAVYSVGTTARRTLW